jgi:hypothetical protein
LFKRKQPDGSTRFYGRIRDRVIRVVATLRPSGRWFVRTVHEDEQATKRLRRDIPAPWTGPKRRSNDWHNRVTLVCRERLFELLLRPR